jgi:general secretion pathway protein G
LAFGDQYSSYLASFGILLAALVMIGYYDFSRLIIPNWINTLLLLFGLFFSARNGSSLFVFASFGAAGVALLFYCLACLYERVRGRSGLGMGDINLCLGWNCWFTLGAAHCVKCCTCACCRSKCAERQCARSHTNSFWPLSCFGIVFGMVFSKYRSFECLVIMNKYLQNLLKHARTNEGYSLVELLVVLGIMALLSAMVAPQVIRYLSSARSETAKTQLRNLEAALELYNIDTGTYPTETEGLIALIKTPKSAVAWRGPYLKREDALRDPWGQTYVYRNPGEHGVYDVLSLGKDGKPGGESEDRDIVNW